VTDRGSPQAGGAPACPFVAFEDERDERSDVPDHRHRCYAVPRPEPRAFAHQEAYCLSPNFAACPIFQDWARREAARTKPAATSGRAPTRRPEEDEAGQGPEVAAGAAVAGDELDPLSSGPAARKRSAGRTWANPPPWASGSAAGIGASPGEEVGARGAEGEGGQPRPTSDSGETPAFLTARERGGDRAERAAPNADESAEAAAFATGRRSYDEDAAGYEDDRYLEEDRYEERPQRAGALAALAGLGGLFRRDPRPRAGAPRAIRQADIDRGAPSWERPRRSEAYPTLKTRMRLPGMSPLLIGLLALGVAAIVLFALPGLFLTSGPGTGGASPSPSGGPSAVASPTPSPSPTQLTYTIAKGDTLARIAKKYKLTVEQLLAANPQIKDPNKIAAGDVLNIPSSSPSPVVDAGSPSPSPSS
jgi:nucleoid-associated protein YgaU